jgi:glutamate dehydrogenase
VPMAGAFAPRARLALLRDLGEAQARLAAARLAGRAPEAARLAAAAQLAREAAMAGDLAALTVAARAMATLG